MRTDRKERIVCNNCAATKAGEECDDCAGAGCSCSCQGRESPQAEARLERKAYSDESWLREMAKKEDGADVSVGAAHTEAGEQPTCRKCGGYKDEWIHLPGPLAHEYEPSSPPVTAGEPRCQEGIPACEVIEPFDTPIPLLPCPFCGSTNLEHGNLGQGDDWFISCRGCEVQQIANYDKYEAVERWNRRQVKVQENLTPKPTSVPAGTARDVTAFSFICEFMGWDAGKELLPWQAKVIKGALAFAAQNAANLQHKLDATTNQLNQELAHSAELRQERDALERASVDAVLARERAESALGEAREALGKSAEILKALYEAGSRTGTVSRHQIWQVADMCTALKSK